MKSGRFIFDGVSSEEIKTIIQSRPTIEAPLRKVSWRSTYGIDGDIPFDEGAYDTTDLDLLMLIDGSDLISDRQKFYNLIDSRGVYKEFIPYFDPDKIYRVMLNDKPSFQNNYMYGQKQAVSTKFRVKPYKYLVDNSPITTTSKTFTATNPTNYVAQPIIKITGTGAVTIQVNGINFNIKNVPNTIVIDSERYSAYQEGLGGVLSPMNDQILTREYPIFKPGVNNIVITGSVTQTYIEPRWRSLV